MGNGNATPVRDFHNEHSGGSEDGFIISQGYCYYKDGACRENHAFGLLKPPPEDPYQRWRLILNFHTIKLEFAIREFTALKRNLLALTTPRVGYPTPSAPPQEEIDKLAELKKKVSKCQLKVERAQAQMESHKSPQAVAREEKAERNLDKCNTARSKIQSIEV